MSTKTTEQQLAQLRGMAHSGHRGATAALCAARDLARHSNRGGWAECEQARGDYSNYCPDLITASADEVADAIREEKKCC